MINIELNEEVCYNYLNKEVIMGIFKSKQEKEMEQRLLIKRTLSKIQKYINELEAQKSKYIEAAKTAKNEGLQGQYNLAVSGLKMAMGQQKKAKEMLMNIELTAEMRDLTKVTAGFLSGMSLLSKEMSKTTKNMDFAKVQKQFEMAMTGVEETEENLDAMLENSDVEFSGLGAQASKIDDKELEAFIANQLASEDSGIDKQIDEALANIKSKIEE